jgi:hypothetical protein
MPVSNEMPLTVSLPDRPPRNLERTRALWGKGFALAAASPNVGDALHALPVKSDIAALMSSN